MSFIMLQMILIPWEISAKPLQTSSKKARQYLLPPILPGQITSQHGSDFLPSYYQSQHNNYHGQAYNIPFQSVSQSNVDEPPTKTNAQYSDSYEDQEAFEMASDIVNNYMDIKESDPDFFNNPMAKYIFRDIASAGAYLNNGKHSRTIKDAYKI